MYFSPAKMNSRFSSVWTGWKTSPVVFFFFTLAVYFSIEQAGGYMKGAIGGAFHIATGTTASQLDMGAQLHVDCFTEEQQWLA